MGRPGSPGDVADLLRRHCAAGALRGRLRPRRRRRRRRATSNKAFLTEEEYTAAAEGRGRARSTAHAEAIAEGNFGRALQSGVTDPTFPQRQTSLIVDPPNGKLPELTAEGKRLSALMKSSWALPGRNADLGSLGEDFDSWDRCITRGMPSSMMPYRYNNGVEIIQAPG